MKDFEVVHLEPNEPVTEKHLSGPFERQLRPTKLFVLPEGSVENKPSFAWHLVDSEGRTYIAQISEKMLRNGLLEAEALRCN